MSEVTCWTCFRLCFQPHYFKVMGNLKKILEICVPEMKIYLSEDSTLCRECLIFLNSVDCFRTKCINNHIIARNTARKNSRREIVEKTPSSNHNQNKTKSTTSDFQIMPKNNTSDLEALRVEFRMDFLRMLQNSSNLIQENLLASDPSSSPSTSTLQQEIMPENNASRIETLTIQLPVEQRVVLEPIQENHESLMEEGVRKDDIDVIELSSGNSGDEFDCGDDVYDNISLNDKQEITEEQMLVENKEELIDIEYNEIQDIDTTAGDEDDMSTDYLDEFKYVRKENPRFFNRLFSDNYYHCSLCNEKYPDSDQLSKHTKLNHKEVKFFHCEHCNFFSLHRSALHHHVSHFHKTKSKGDGSKKSYICSECDKVYYTLQGLKRHEYVVHENNQPDRKFAACCFCTKRFSFKKHLKMHVFEVHKIKLNRMENSSS